MSVTRDLQGGGGGRVIVGWVKQGGSNYGDLPEKCILSPHEPETQEPGLLFSLQREREREREREKEK